MLLTLIIHTVTDDIVRIISVATCLCTICGQKLILRSYNPGLTACLKLTQFLDRRDRIILVWPGLTNVADADYSYSG